MSNAHDPFIESLFEQAEQELTDKQYTERLMVKIVRRRRNVLLGRVSIVGLIVVLELLLSAPLQGSIGVATQVLSTSLLQLENEWAAAAFAPLNSVAGLLGMLFLAMHTLYRRTVR